MKKLLYISLLLIGFTAKAQIPFSAYALLLKNGNATIAGTANGTVYYNTVDNKFYFRQNDAWISINPTASTVSFGSSTQLPIMNSGGTDYTYSNNLRYDIINNNFSANATLTNTNTGTQNNNFLLGHLLQLTGTSGNIRWAQMHTEQGILTSDGASGVMHNPMIEGGFNNKIEKTSGFNSFSCGIVNSNNSYIGALTASTTSSLIFAGRNDTIHNASNAFACGYRMKVTGDGSFGHGFFNTYSGGSHTGTIPSCEISAKGAFGFFTNTSSGVIGRGIHGDYGIAFGFDPYIPSGALRNVILAGESITARSGENDQVYTPSLNFTTKPTKNNALPFLLSIDTTVTHNPVKRISLIQAVNDKPIETLSATTTLTLDNGSILLNVTGSDFTVNIPSAASAYDSGTKRGHEYVFKMISASGTVTIDPAGSDQVEFASTQSITGQGTVMRIQSNGTAWYAVGQ